jgi:D-2-hydroxyacid dehydrogenase (NADP+)
MVNAARRRPAAPQRRALTFLRFDIHLRDMATNTTGYRGRERSEHPVILVTAALTAEQSARLRAAVPGARVVAERDVSADPGLARQVEICYTALPQGLWRSADGLRWLQSDMAGVETVIRAAEAAHHPAVITNVHIHGATIAEHLWGMTLMLTRNLNRSSRLQAAGVWNRGAAVEGLSSLAGRTLCVAGLGAIGEKCAALGRAFGMRVIGIRRHPAPSQWADEVVGPESRTEAFSRSRVIMVVLPDTPQTRRFVGREEMAAMDGAFLLNAGRGSSIDTDALVEALRNGTVRGAGLDVTDPEPLPAGHPLWAMENVVITPHYGGAHPGYGDEAFEVFMDNLGRWMRGEQLRNVVDRTAEY